MLFKPCSPKPGPDAHPLAHILYYEHEHEQDKIRDDEIASLKQRIKELEEKLNRFTH